MYKGMLKFPFLVSIPVKIDKQYSALLYTAELVTTIPVIALATNPTTTVVNVPINGSQRKDTVYNLFSPLLK